MTMADSSQPERFSCFSCGEPIEVRPNAPLGTPYYKHADPVVLSSHMPVRAPERSLP